MYDAVRKTDPEIAAIDLVRDEIRGVVAGDQPARVAGGFVDFEGLVCHVRVIPLRNDLGQISGEVNCAISPHGAC